MKIRPFELALIIIFIVLALAALLLLANYQSSGSGDNDGLAQVGQVTIWGTLPRDAVEAVLSNLELQNEVYRNVEYRYYAPSVFDDRLTNALADGRAPDLLLVSQEKLVELRRRIQPLSYENTPLRDVRTRYVDGAEIFAMQDGVYALPVAVDPLMLYWNRNILGTNGFLEAPSTWESLVNTMFPELIERDFSRTVTQSVVAMGQYNNIRNGFGILSLFLLQSGSAMVEERAVGEYSIQLQSAVAGGGNPLRSSVDFYTRFSQPSNALYSWNRALEEDRLEFVAEDLVFYFGYASEGPVIERLNPNLNFDIAEVPQGANASVRRTYGKFYGLALVRASDNLNGAYAIMQHLASQPQADALAISNNMAPVYRTSVSAGSNDKYGRLAYRSAGVAFGWLNPSRQAVDAVFTTMTSDINENRRDLSSAVSDATARLQAAY